MLVVQMHGESGSGKSTVARTLARAIGALVLDKDVVKAALLRSGIAEEQAAPAAYEVYWGIAASLLGQGCSLVLDTPAYWPIVQQRSRETAAAAGAAYAMVECVCSDRPELERRLATRTALESQPRAPFDFTSVEGIVPPTCERVVLDTTRPLAECVRDAVNYVRGGVPA
jgi:predicted kinase